MRFGILGPLAVWTAAGDKVTVSQSLVRALLVSLLVGEGRPVSVNRLVDNLWGEDMPADPVRALHTKVWQLRRVLDAAEPGARNLVTSRSPGYALTVDAHSLDALRFRDLVAGVRETADPRVREEVLTTALDLWRGPALADFADTEFARSTIDWLENQRLGVVEDRVEAVVELGRHSEVVSELDLLVSRHPLRERLRAAHMRALHRSGRLTEALRSYDEMRVLLVETHGLDPSPELSELRQAIVEQRPDLRSPSAPGAGPPRPRTNVPVVVNSLTGRETVLAQVCELLRTDRLVTLTGIGGVGKTRLALAVAEELADEYPDGVWFAGLAQLETSAGVDRETGLDALVELVVAALGVRDEPVVRGVPVSQPAGSLDRLAGVLRDGRMLLVLDNCEHVVDAAAELTSALLEAAPGLVVLATSRESLGVAGETLWTVPPLDLPDVDGVPDVDVVRRSSAVRLFVERAAQATPSFTLDADNVDAVLKICASLDGIPFALELAATRVRTLGVHGLASRLTDRFGVLTAGRRDALPRQQTLQATVDWSWDLLTDVERVVLRRLSVHVGGCTVAAAEAVCAGDEVERADVLDAVARLVDKSLVAMVDDKDGPRYHLLEVVTAYAAGRLAEVGEVRDTQLRHVRYYAEFAETAADHLRGVDQRYWLERLDLESANLRCALDYADRWDAAEHALRLVNATAWYWFLRGRLGEGLRALTAALGVGGDAHPGRRTAVMAWRAGFAMRAGVPQHPLDGFDELLERFESIDDPKGRAMAGWFLGFVQIGYGDHHVVESRVGRALAQFRDLGDEWGIAAALSTLATQAALNGDLRAIERHGTASAAAFREVGDAWGELQATAALALLAEVEGDYERAARLHEEGLHSAEKLGLWTEVSIKLSGLGRIALLTGDYPEGVRLHERAAKVAAEQGFTFGEQFADVGLGLAHRRQGNLDKAERYLRKWLDWCRRIEGDVGSALILAELGFIAEQRGHAEAAMSIHLEGFAAARNTRDPRSLALSLEGLAGAHVVAGLPERAATLLGAAAAIRDRTSAPLPEAERGDVSRISANSRFALGAAGFDAHYGRGRLLAPERVLEIAVS